MLSIHVISALGHNLMKPLFPHDFILLHKKEMIIDIKIVIKFPTEVAEVLCEDPH